ncbi:MAG: hypothetical protein AUK34_14220 [Ignavibacteria bacterium CG2_30_36_16]|nr:FkbM family methyltransferase [Ignavibacteria bacterium]OIP54956.1 MAG: hypothetical protein AUK34_14220 [Ignavibacteria bacterium CG2_30_36_16]
MAITFKEKIKTAALLLKEPDILNALISFRHSGYLKDTGWINSYKKKQPVDAENNPLPWMTHSFIHFIANKLTKELSVFEYGSGNSTLYFAEKVKSVTSLEHNEEWFRKMKEKTPSNVALTFNKFPSDDYSMAITKSEKKFDIIIDDAMDRLNVIYNSYQSLTEQGVFILDDSEREEYNEGIEFLLNKKFRKLDFWGLAPGVLFDKCTSVFYKSHNCLGI